MTFWRFRLHACRLYVNGCVVEVAPHQVRNDQVQTAQLYWGFEDWPLQGLVSTPLQPITRVFGLL